MDHLTISIVTYDTCPGVFRHLVSSLNAAILALDPERYEVSIDLVDNSRAGAAARWTRAFDVPVRYHSGHGNIGYGRGHNFALPYAGSYHLVLNPDVWLSPDALVNGLAFLEQNPRCGLLSPRAEDADGRRQYLARRHPTVPLLFLRGFVPGRGGRPFRRWMAWHEMHEQTGDDVFWGAPVVSGCFMLMRGAVFRRVGGFDPGFFLYFEDFDLSRRVSAVADIAYVPSVRIVHHGGRAGRKGWRHLVYFGRSGFRYFRKWGGWWRSG